MAVPTIDATGTLVEFNGSDPSPIAIPSGWSSGLIVGVFGTWARSGVSFSNGVGSWNTIGSILQGWADAGSFPTVGISAGYKALGGSDPSTTLNLDQTSGGSTSSQVLRISGHDTTTPINVHGNTETASGTSHVSPSVTTTVNDCLIIRVMHATGDVGSFSASSGDTGTRLVDGSELQIWYSSLATAGATGTATYTTDYGSIKVRHLVFAIAPTGGAAATGLIIPRRRSLRALLVR